jgi:hypothetical protein
MGPGVDVPHDYFFVNGKQYVLLISGLYLVIRSKFSLTMQESVV